MTRAGLRVQRVTMTYGDAESWMVLDSGGSVVEPVEAFLSHLHAVERSPNTVRAYAHDLRDYFEFVGQVGLDWSSVELEDVGRFVAWLRLPSGARADTVVALPSAQSQRAESTVNRKLSAIAAFYGVDLGGPADELATPSGAGRLVAAVAGASGFAAGEDPLRHELDRLALVTLATGDGHVAQRSTLTAGQKTILSALNLPEPPRFFDFTPEPS